MSLDEYLDAASAEKAARLRQQWKDANATGVVTCVCGLRRHLTRAYRCLYCGEWYCFPCAQVHFGQTVREWREEKRVEMRVALRGQIFIRGEGI